MELRHNADQSRYEVEVDGQLAGFTEYVERDGRYVFTHTEVSDAFGGQGIGSGVTKFALDDMLAKGAKVIPQCSFTAAYIKSHSEYASLVEAK